MALITDGYPVILHYLCSEGFSQAVHTRALTHFQVIRKPSLAFVQNGYVTTLTSGTSPVYELLHSIRIMVSQACNFVVHV